MKTNIKIIALALFALAGQVQGGQFQPGPNGFIAACQTPGVTSLAKFKDPFKNTFGLAPSNDVCNPNVLKAVADIQTFVADAAKYTAGNFVNPTVAAQFVNNFLQFGSLFEKNSKVFPTNYLDQASSMVEDTADDAVTALTAEVATTNRFVPAGLPAKPTTQADFNQIATAVQAVDNNLKTGFDFLNSITIAWDPATKIFMPKRLGTAAALNPAFYQKPLSDIIQITFATHLQQLTARAIDPIFTTLIQDPASKLDVTNLDPATPPVASRTLYTVTEQQAQDLIDAMVNEVLALNRMVEGINKTPAFRFAGFAGFTAGTGKLRDKVTQEITALSAAINQTNGIIVRAANKLTPNPLTPAAPAVAPVTLKDKTQALLDALTTGGASSAAIDAYLASLPNVKATTVPFPPILTHLKTLIDTTRTDLGYTLNSPTQYQSIVKILSQVPAAVAGKTTKDTVESAIEYLTGQLYIATMWLTKNNLLSPVASPLPATVGELAKQRIKQLFATIDALNTDKTTLATQKTALQTLYDNLNTQFRAGGGVITHAAETNGSVTASEASAEKVAMLTDCVALKAAAAASAAKLAALPAAVDAMAVALNQLVVTAKVTTPALNGAALATSIATNIQNTAKTGALDREIVEDFINKQKNLDLNLNPTLQFSTTYNPGLTPLTGTFKDSAAKDVFAASVMTLGEALNLLLPATAPAKAADDAATLAQLVRDNIKNTLPAPTAANEDANVVALATEIQTAGGLLTPAVGIVTNPPAAGKADLGKTKTAVKEMVIALNNLSVGVIGIPKASGANLANAISAQIAATTRGSVANDLMDNTSRAFGMKPVTLDLRTVTANAPKANAALSQVADYLRGALDALNTIAYNVLKIPANQADIPTLLTAATNAITGLTTAAPVAAAAIPQVVIDAHNASVAQAIIKFNTIKPNTNARAEAMNLTTKKAVFDWIVQLNQAAVAINAISAAAAQTITVTNTDAAGTTTNVTTQAAVTTASNAS